MYNPSVVTSPGTIVASGVLKIEGSPVTGLDKSLCDGEPVVLEEVNDCTIDEVLSEFDNPTKDLEVSKLCSSDQTITRPLEIVDDVDTELLGSRLVSSDDDVQDIDQIVSEFIEPDVEIDFTCVSPDDVTNAVGEVDCTLLIEDVDVQKSGNNLENSEEDLIDAKKWIRKLRNREHAKQSRARSNEKLEGYRRTIQELERTRLRSTEEIWRLESLVDLLMSWLEPHDCQYRLPPCKASRSKLSPTSPFELVDNCSEKASSGSQKEPVVMKGTTNTECKSNDFEKSQLFPLVEKHNDIISNTSGLEKCYEKHLSPWDVGYDRSSSDSIIGRHNTRSNSYYSRISIEKPTGNISVLNNTKSLIRTVAYVL